MCDVLISGAMWLSGGWLSGTCGGRYPYIILRPACVMIRGCVCGLPRGSLFVIIVAVNFTLYVSSR